MEVADRVATALACIAVDPRLAGLLFLDLDPVLVYPLARWLVSLIDEARGLPDERLRTRVIPVGPKMTEERLWARIQRAPARADRPEEGGFHWAPGPLAGYERPPGVVVISDLALVGLNTARAAVMLIGAEVAHLERSGVSRMWHPRDTWLAALRRQDAGSVSSHLLDRFAVRIDARELAAPRAAGPVLPEADPLWKQAILAARDGAGLPPLTSAAADRILAMHPLRPNGTRRDLALGRVARALAALGAAPEVTPGHVDLAAELTGQQPQAWPVLGGATGIPDDDHGGLNGFGRHAPVRHRKASVNGGPTGLAAQSDGPGEGGIVRAAADMVAIGPALGNGANGHLRDVPHGTPEPLPPQPAGDDVTPGNAARPAGPYPEDDARPAHDVAPLRIGWQRALAGPPRGHPIGTQRTLDKGDIAVMATLLHAARYQRRRCPAHFRENHRLHVRAADLLGYRRAAHPGQFLLLLLDHTCRIADWDWYPPLGPYLQQAHLSRALIGVVEVGALAKTRDVELRATQFRARSLLDPRVASALERPAGRATPLAHGLTLAAAMLRHDTQQGRGLVSGATLIVITDGRANVPLADSQAGLSPGCAVYDTAISDAEDAARKISALRRVRSIVIDPRAGPYGHLAARLAWALDAVLVDGACGAHARDGAV